MSRIKKQVRQDLFSEISNMQKLSHPNLVRLHGVVFGDPIFMVIEFCENGALLDRLRSPLKVRLLVTRLLNYAQQIANGMTYLESRGFVHRDLAARNVLLTENEEVVKICDFGLTRSLNENERLYVMSAPKKVPFSWCPPESLRFRQFSHKSDVWAFGVTLWELFTYGEEPFIGCKAVDVLKLSESGERLRIPDYCSRELFDIITMCWNLSAESRPKFSHLRNLLHDVKFMTAVCREPTLTNSVVDEKALLLEMNEKVILISERDDKTWFGQSLTSRKFGTFQRSTVTLRSHRAAQQLSACIQPNHSQMPMPRYAQTFHRREISHPIPGSWIHTGHGDTSEEKSWGYVDKIDPIYLRNPVVDHSFPNRSSMQPISFIPSVSALHDPSGVEFSNFDNSWSNSFGQRRRSAHDLNSKDLIPNDATSNAKPITLPKPYRPHAVISPDLFSNVSSNAIFSGLNLGVEPYQKISEVASMMIPESSKWTKDDRAKSETRIYSRRIVANNASATTLNDLALNGNSMQKANHQKPKYDSAISVPRPQPNRSSPLPKQDVAFFTGIKLPPEKSDNFIQTIASKPSTSSLPSYNRQLPLNTASNSFAIGRTIETTTAAAVLTPTTDNSTPISLINIPEQQTMSENSKQALNDPFVVDDSVKTLATKSRYNDVLTVTQPTIISQPNGNTNSYPTAVIAQQTNISRHSQPPSSTPLNNINQAGKCEITAQAESVNSSFLPPPSDLLLSGNLVLSSFDITPTNTQKPTQQQPYSPYQPIFAIGDHVKNCNQRSENSSRIRYGTNGIPILEPLPAPLIFQKPSNKTLDKSAPKPIIIGLKDLDTDGLIAQVQHKVDFATAEQCRLSLRKHNFDVENAVRDLKVEKLLEMGIAGDRHLAASALDSCNWDVNTAANQLVS